MNRRTVVLVVSAAAATLGACLLYLSPWRASATGGASAPAERAAESRAQSPVGAPGATGAEPGLPTSPPPSEPPSEPLPPVLPGPVLEVLHRCRLEPNDLVPFEDDGRVVLLWNSGGHTARRHLAKLIHAGLKSAHDTFASLTEGRAAELERDPDPTVVVSLKNRAKYAAVREILGPSGLPDDRSMTMRQPPMVITYGEDLFSSSVFQRQVQRMVQGVAYEGMLVEIYKRTCDGARVWHILEIVPIGDLADREGEKAQLRVAVLGGKMLGAAEGTTAAAAPTEEATSAPAGYAETKNIGPDEWELSADAVRDLRENFASYFDETNLRSFYDVRTRKLQGLQVRARVENPRFTSFGIVNRDVITEIHGLPVRAVQDIIDLIRLSPDAATVVFGILRDGKPLQLTYHVHPEGGAPVRELPRVQPAAGDPLGWRHASAPEPARALPMDMEGMDLGGLLDAVSELAGTAFICGEGVDGSVRRDVKLFFRCPQPVPEARVLLALQCLLEVNGLTLAPVRGVAAGQVCSIEALPWFHESRQRRTPVAPEVPRNPEPPAPADPLESQDTSGSPGTISFSAPEGCDVGSTYRIPIFVDAGDRYLAAYGIELQWDSSARVIEAVAGGGGSFDPPFVVDLQNDRGQLRFNGISIRPVATGKVPIAVLKVKVLARPISGPAIIGPLSTNQTVAVYADDGTTPIIVPEPRVQPLELQIR